jgi:hypothetical protein
MLRLLISLLAGALFGEWGPSLAFVMGAAVLVTLVCFRFVLKRPAPFLGDRFHVPTLTHIDRRLVIGDWCRIVWHRVGPDGLLPWASLSHIAIGQRRGIWFVPAMFLGGFLHRKLS